MKWENRDINVTEWANIPTFSKLDDIVTPLRLLQLFFDDVIVDMIVGYTKLYSHRATSISWNRRKLRKDGKFHKSDQILNQTKTNVKLCLGKISLQKTLRIKFSVDSGFSNELCGKKRKPGNAGN